MSVKIGVFPTKSMGLNKSEVDLHIQTLIKQHLELVDQYKKRIEMQKNENEKVQKELDGYKEQEKLLVMSDEFKELIMNRARKIPEILNKSADMEMEEIMEMEKRSMEEYNIEISNIKKDIQSTKTHIDSLLKDFTVLFEEEKHTKKEEEKCKIIREYFPDTADCSKPETENLDLKKLADSYKSNEVKRAALAEEINQTRCKYIVGKIAGENLFDRDNNVIISKNEVITNDVIKKAETEGKLEELIVKMTLPGLGEY